MLLMGLGIIFLVLSYQNYFSKIKRKEAELLLKASLESEKKERVRIAADLHDSVSSDLSAIRNYLIHLTNTESDSSKKELFQELNEGVATAIENTRMISYNLMPPLLATSGLIPTFEDYFDRLRKSSTVLFESDFVVSNLKISSEISYELYRIIQEFTTNMLKYGRSNSCKIKVYEWDENLCIEFSDDGTPYNFNEALARSKGTGLKNINSRIKVINAVLSQKPSAIGNHFLITLKKNL